MVEIEYRPYGKIVVHEVRKLDVPTFFQGVVSQVEAQKQGGIPTVNWVDGIAFVIAEFIPSPQTVEENLKGIAHYAFVLFTETSFQEEKRVTSGGRESIVRVVKAESNPIFVELVKFLKSFKP
ncbi:MAG TPA: hypothetical protein VGS11_04930 [Candidatus Bathyarchaeia archaeon]|nr:hypothetical protein [Candidatus Bathyarchaeia archaeon]